MTKDALLSILVVAVLLAVGVIAEAQQPEKVPQIGYVIGSSLSSSLTRREAFRLEMFPLWP